MQSNWSGRLNQSIDFHSLLQDAAHSVFEARVRSVSSTNGKGAAAKDLIERHSSRGERPREAVAGLVHQGHGVERVR
jgi:hypothetical protein